jgi:hypothetical protein
MRKFSLLIFILTGCTYFHAGTFFTTSPLYYTDLFPGNAEEWEQRTWEETGRMMKEEYPEEIFNDVCQANLDQMLKPKTNSYHAFNYNKIVGMHNQTSNFVIYPIGQVDVLFHEYIHSRNSQFSDKCLSEMIAISLTKKWTETKERTYEFNQH